MSKAETERFIAAAKSDAGMRSEVDALPVTIDAVVAFARGKGYDVTVEDAKAHLAAKLGEELSDEKLDAIAGGKSREQKAGVDTAVTVTAVGLWTHL